MIPSTSSTPGWLTLRDACKQLGVSPATLRQWADTGKVESFRTPGGHRRFRITKLQTAPTAPSIEPAHRTRQIELLIHSAVGRARMEIASGKLDHEKWHSMLNRTARAQHRKLGQRLMALLIQVLQNESDQSNWLDQAHQIGKEYAQVSLQQGTSLADILRAYLFFRDYVFEGLFELSASADFDTLNTFRRLNEFINTVLIDIVEAYTGGKKRK
jgi:excisionase family DNA binding protein